MQRRWPVVGTAKASQKSRAQVRTELCRRVESFRSVYVVLGRKAIKRHRCRTVHPQKFAWAKLSTLMCSCENLGERIERTDRPFVPRLLTPCHLATFHPPTFQLCHLPPGRWVGWRPAGGHAEPTDPGQLEGDTTAQPLNRSTPKLPCCCPPSLTLGW